MLPVETSYIRPRTFIVFVPVLIGVALFIYLQSTHLHQDLLWAPLALCITSSVIWLALRKVYLLVDSDGLTYKTVFSSKSIFWRDITKTYIKYSQHGESGSRNWYFENGEKSVFEFSTDLYSRANLRVIAEAVISRCETAEIQQKIQQMANGKFPWYIF